jgi:predicted transcriptional regulator
MKIVSSHYKHLLGKMPFSEWMKQELKVIDMLEAAKHKGVSKSALLQGLGVKAQTLNQIIDTLEEKDAISRRVVTNSPTKKATIFYLRRYAPKI